MISDQFNNWSLAAKLGTQTVLPLNELDHSEVMISSEKLLWSADAQYYIGGRNKDDYSAHGRLGYYFHRALGVDAHAGLSLLSPSFFESTYMSDNFIWGNNFLKKKVQTAGATLSSPKYKFEATADYYLLNDYIYFNEEALPAQIAEQKLMALRLNDRIRVGRFNL